LIEKAVEYKSKIVIQPDDIKNQTKDYFDDNDSLPNDDDDNCANYDTDYEHHYTHIDI
jgi:hypothetical protein